MIEIISNEKKQIIIYTSKENLKLLDQMVEKFYYNKDEEE